MVDIWKYDGISSGKITVLCKTGKRYSGYVITVEAKEDDPDGLETEDCITLDLIDGRIMSFYPSEIEHIEED